MATRQQPAVPDLELRQLVDSLRLLSRIQAVALDQLDSRLRATRPGATPARKRGR